jgi:hypothetical protein
MAEAWTRKQTRRRRVLARKLENLVEEIRKDPRQGWARIIYDFKLWSAEELFAEVFLEEDTDSPEFLPGGDKLLVSKAAWGIVRSLAEAWGTNEEEAAHRLIAEAKSRESLNLKLAEELCTAHADRVAHGDSGEDFLLVVPDADWTWLSDIRELMELQACGGGPLRCAEWDIFEMLLARSPLIGPATVAAA